MHRKQDEVSSTGHPITIVTGLPRSGTSMMMRMLEAGGVEVLTDNLREADQDNPRGYYELEKVKRIAEDHGWLAEARGKAFKMVSMLLFDLPPQHFYRIVFMERAMDEILASQNQMMIRKGLDPSVGPDDRAMAAGFAAHLAKVKAWLGAQPNMHILYMEYGDIVWEPLARSERVDIFLGKGLDTTAMAAVVEPSLYRQRG
jgi:hypothetical protein